MPTRLLDWTENPFIGLYFAVMSAPCEIRRGTLNFLSDAAVWILDPIQWNRHALSSQSFDGGILSPVDEALKGYRLATGLSEMNTSPVALWGAHNSPRIVAQRGVFTVFGKSILPIEKVFEKDSYPSNCLVKIIFQKKYLPGIREANLRNGITESVVFPDLEGLAQEIRRTFDFED